MTAHDSSIPATEVAVQLVGPDRLVLNRAKPTFTPGPHQILARVEAVGLCFSDLKLLKQFDAHPRKGAIVGGISPAVLAEIPSYVPGAQPTVPGHEVCCRIVAVGNQVTRHAVGERCLVQTDYRTLPTNGSNAAFGYTFEGGLQEYVLMDERVVIDERTGERLLIRVPEDLSASAVAMVEPWACVEDSYAYRDRQTVKAGGRLLVVAEAGASIQGVAEAIAASGGEPASVTTIGPDDPRCAEHIAALPAESFDDIIYFGHAKATIEVLNDKLAAHGIINLVLGGHPIGALVSVGVGRVHYGMTRWIGTTGFAAVLSYAAIPDSGELRPRDSLLVLGAGGPMGQMHVLRGVCTEMTAVRVVGTDVDDARLEALRVKAEPLARKNGIRLRLVNTTKEPVTERFSYQVILVPAGPLVAAAVQASADGGLINIFAGIPAATRQDLDLDTYIARRCYMFGTSGSEVRDMEIVLERLMRGQIETNTSIDAVSGMAGAIEGIAAVEHRTLSGKVVVYPALPDMGLVPLTALETRMPSVAAKLDGGRWCKAAEDELLRQTVAAIEGAG